MYAQTEDARCAPPRRACGAGAWRTRALLYGGLTLAFVFGGPVLRAAALASLLCGLLADADGGLRHAMRLAGLAAVVAFAPGLGAALGDWLAARTGMPFVAARVTGIGACGVGLLLAAGIAGRGLRALARRSPRLDAFDRLCGAGLGVAEGALLVAVGGWTLQVFAQPLERMSRQLRDGQAGSPQLAWAVDRLVELNGRVEADPTGRWLSSVNPMSEWPAVRVVRQLAQLASDPQALDAVVEAPEIRALVELPVVQRHVEAIQADQALRTALEQRDFRAVFRNPRWGAVLADRELYEALAAHLPDVCRALERAAQSAGSPTAPPAPRPARAERVRAAPRGG